MFSDIDIREKTLFAALLGFALVIKGVLIFQADIINPDGIRYVNSASELFQGNLSAAFGHERQLGYTALLGLVHMVIPDWLLAGQVLSSVCLVLTTVPLYLLTRDLFSDKAALCAALAFCVAPFFNELSTEVVKEPVHALIVATALWLVVQALRRENLVFMFWAGFLSCFSVAVRIDGLFFFLVVSLCLLLSSIFNRDGRRQQLSHLAAYSVLPLVGALFLLAATVAGGLAPDSISGVYTKFRHYFEIDPLKIYQGIYQRLKEVEAEFNGGQWTNDFFELARHNMYLVYLVGLLQIFGKAVFPVFLVPLWFGLHLKKYLSRSVLLYLSVLLSYLLMGYFFLLTRNFLASRYLLISVLLAFPLIGLGFEHLLVRFGSFRFQKLAGFVVVVLCVLLPVGKSFSNVLGEKIEIKEAGEWLAGHRDLSAVKVIVNSERVAFYAGLLRGEYDMLPQSAPGRYEKRALRSESSLMVLLIDAKRQDDLPGFEHFTLIKSFKGRKKIVKIYERTE